jgi:hypothetical protein
MNEQDDEVAHPGNGNNTSRPNLIQANLPIRQGQVQNVDGVIHVVMKKVGRLSLDPIATSSHDFH